MTFTRDELEKAFELWHGTIGDCVQSNEWGPFIALFTEDAEYHEISAGLLRGHEQIRGWVDFAMAQFPGTEFVDLYEHWHVIDEQAGTIVAKLGNVMRDPGDGSRLDVPNIAVLRYAGDGKFSAQEDWYDPAAFVNQVMDWGARAIAAGGLTDEQKAFFDPAPASAVSR